MDRPSRTSSGCVHNRLTEHAHRGPPQSWGASTVGRDPIVGGHGQPLETVGRHDPVDIEHEFHHLRLLRRIGRGRDPIGRQERAHPLREREHDRLLAIEGNAARAWIRALDVGQELIAHVCHGVESG